MSDANPYSAPDAALDTEAEVLYQPRIFTFGGRIGRVRYLAYSFGISFLLMFVVTFLTAFLSASGGGGVLDMVAIVVTFGAYAVLLVLTLGFARRRFNDLDRSGWWLLTFLVPLVNIAASIYLMFFPGSDGPNKFGSAPVANSTATVIVAWLVLLVPLIGIAAAVLIPMFVGQ